MNCDKSFGRDRYTMALIAESVGDVMKVERLLDVVKTRYSANSKWVKSITKILKRMKEGKNEIQATAHTL